MGIRVFYILFVPDPSFFQRFLIQGIGTYFQSKKLIPKFLLLTLPICGFAVVWKLIFPWSSSLLRQPIIGDGSFQFLYSRSRESILKV
jgi:hypothetical protein